MHDAVHKLANVFVDGGSGVVVDRLQLDAFDANDAEGDSASFAARTASTTGGAQKEVVRPGRQSESRRVRSVVGTEADRVFHRFSVRHSQPRPKMGERPGTER